MLGTSHMAPAGSVGGVGVGLVVAVAISVVVALTAFDVIHFGTGHPFAEFSEFVAGLGEFVLLVHVKD